MVDVQEQLFFSRKQEYKKHSDIKTMVESLIEEHLKDVEDISQQHFQVMLEYVKKYQKIPPKYLPKAVHALIGNTYHSVATSKEQGYFKNLAQLQQVVTFLQKTTPKFHFSEHQLVQRLAKDEKNIFTLAKTIEIMASGHEHHHHGHNQEVVYQLENKIVELSKGNMNPTGPLLVTFQSLVSMGHHKQMKYLLEYFEFGRNLERMNWVELLIKFTPALG